MDDLLADRLRPLLALLDGRDVEEVVVNIPGEAWVYTGTDVTRVAVPDLTLQRISAIAKQAAAANKLVLDDDFPKLSATLASSADRVDRLEVLFPPLVDAGRVALAIRRQRLQTFDLNDLAARGMFDGCRIVRRVRQRPAPDDGEALARAAAAGDSVALLKAAVRSRRTIVAGGPPGAGKTAILNALCGEIPDSERIITIEDVREIRTTQPNVVNLRLSFSNQSVAKLGPQQVMESILRLRPDRILIGECKGPETKVLFELLNTGSPGALTSVHANSAEDAIWRLADLMHKYDEGASPAAMRQYAEDFIDIFVQVERGITGKRRVREILWI